jgi:nicotinate-nucleotide adenylyltransferase
MPHFYKGSALRQGRLGIFPGAFNPPTLAHLAVAAAAKGQHQLDQVVFLLPAQFPHKPFTLLRDAACNEEAFAIASSDHGLFIDIAQEFRAECGPGPELFLLCGKDAAERIVNWDYGSGPSFAEQLDEDRLLVASRRGEYNIPSKYQGKIYTIDLTPSWSECSASEVRKAIAEGKNWRRWVSEDVARRIELRKLYS